MKRLRGGAVSQGSFCRAGTRSGRQWGARDSLVLIRVTVGVGWKEAMGRTALEPDVQSCTWGWGAALWSKTGRGFPLLWQTPHPPLEEPRLLTWTLLLPSPDQGCSKPLGHPWSAGAWGLAGRGIRIHLCPRVGAVSAGQGT